MTTERSGAATSGCASSAVAPPPSTENDLLETRSGPATIIADLRLGDNRGEGPSRFTGLRWTLPAMAASSDPSVGAVSLHGAGATYPNQLLEREAELAAIAALVDGARQGSGRLLAFEGRAGVGKSRLVAATRVP